MKDKISFNNKKPVIKKSKSEGDISNTNNLSRLKTFQFVKFLNKEMKDIGNEPKLKIKELIKKNIICEYLKYDSEDSDISHEFVDNFFLSQYTGEDYNIEAKDQVILQNDNLSNKYEDSHDFFQWKFTKARNNALIQKCKKICDQENVISEKTSQSNINKNEKTLIYAKIDNYIEDDYIEDDAIYEDEQYESQSGGELLENNDD